MRSMALIALVIALAACGGSSPQPSHADRIACRTVYRMQQLYNASGGLPVFASGAQAAQALAASAVGTSQPLNRDMNTAVHRLLLVNTPTTAQLAPMERDCASLGITAKNAETVSVILGRIQLHLRHGPHGREARDYNPR